MNRKQFDGESNLMYRIEPNRPAEGGRGLICIRRRRQRALIIQWIGLIPLRRARLSQHPTDPSFRDAQRIAAVCHRLPAAQAVGSGTIVSAHEELRETVVETI